MVDHIINPLQPTSEEEFLVGSSDLSYFDNNSNRCECGAVMVCRKGHCDITLDSYHGTIRRNHSILMLPGSLLSLKNRSDDFQVEFFSFRPALFAEAAFRIEVDFIRIIKTHPVSQLKGSAMKALNLWLQILEYSYLDRENRFRNTIIKNRLQNALLEMCDKVMRMPNIDSIRPKLSRRCADHFNRFVTLLNEYGSREREVSFYAEKLCISTRYLSTIVQATSGRTVKSMIDDVVLLELKILLQTTDLSIQEIAYRLNFPDQSYLGRFFRKHTGQSPTAFRNSNQ